MNFYIELQLLPDQEVNLGYIWQKVFQQVHFALVEHGYETDRKLENKNTGTVKRLKGSKVAVSFPEYQNHAFPLGSKLRLYAQTKAELEGLMIEKWLNRLVDYVAIAEIKPVSLATQFFVFKQKRVKGVKRLGGSVERKEKHLIKKFGENYSPQYPTLNLNTVFEKETLPFIQIESQTSKQRGADALFKIFIEPSGDVASDDLIFDCYGLRITGN